MHVWPVGLCGHWRRRRSRSGNDNPAIPSDPMRSISRREIPSHIRFGRDWTVNMGGNIAEANPSRVRSRSISPAEEIASAH